MDKVRGRVKFGFVCLLLLFGVSLLSGIMPQNSFIPKAYGASPYLPLSGDAWTENDNATYPWICSPSYSDTISFSTEKVMVGSYALKVNHTSATVAMAFSVDIGATDFTNYDVFVFWLYMAKATYDSTISLTWTTSARFSGNSWKATFTMDVNRWVKFAIPLDAFVVGTATPVWTNRRYFCLSVGGVTASDYTCVYVDGLRAETSLDYYSESGSVDETFMPNLISYTWWQQKAVTIGATTYQSQRSMRQQDGTYDYESLEMESVGQTLFALMIAYNWTGYDFLLNEAKEYWLFLEQSQPNKTRSGYRTYYAAGWSTTGGTTYDGWIMAGLSLLYAEWNNADLLASLHSARRFFVEVIWDSPNMWFDTAYNYATHVITQELSWEAMPQGAMMTGLWAYYKYVQQNATVLSIMNAHSNKGIERQSVSNNKVIYTSSLFEDTIYNDWGYYFAYLATSNSTYLTTLQTLKTLSFANNMLSTNASMYQKVGLGDLAQTYWFDGWGWACALPLWLQIYDLDNDANLLNLYEQAMWDLFPTIKTEDNTVRRYWNPSSSWYQQTWTPSNAFMYAGLSIYYSLVYQPSNPYLISTTRNVTSTSYSNEQLTFTVLASSGQTSTTKIYCGTKGKPHTIEDATSWSYDDATKIATITKFHSSPATITVTWTGIPDTSALSVIANFNTAISILGLAVVAVMGSIVVFAFKFGNLDMSALVLFFAVTVIIILALVVCNLAFVSIF